MINNITSLTVYPGVLLNPASSDMTVQTNFNQNFSFITLFWPQSVNHDIIHGSTIIITCAYGVNKWDNFCVHFYIFLESPYIFYILESL